MNGKEYTFDNREKAVECMEGRLATVKDLEFHVLKFDREENLRLTEIRMVLKTEERTIAVKMPSQIFDTFEIKVKQFYDRYTRFW